MNGFLALKASLTVNRGATAEMGLVKRQSSARFFPGGEV